MNECTQYNAHVVIM